MKGHLRRINLKITSKAAILGVIIVAGKDEQQCCKWLRIDSTLPSCICELKASFDVIDSRLRGSVISIMRAL